MVRRLKSEFVRFDGLRKFPRRKLEPLEVAYTAEEKAVHAALRRYTQLRGGHTLGNTEKFATEFVLKTLKKRLFSCPFAFASTLAQHEKSLATATRKRTTRPSVGILQRQIDKADEEYADDAEYESATDDAVNTASRLFCETTSEEKQLLKQMKDWAAKATAQPDSKAKILIQWLKDNIRPGGKWSDQRVIIFTEYRATQNWLQERLAYDGFRASDGRLLTLYGGMDSQHREDIKAAFQAHPSKHPVRILLATDERVIPHQIGIGFDTLPQSVIAAARRLKAVGIGGHDLNIQVVPQGVRGAARLIIEEGEQLVVASFPFLL